MANFTYLVLDKNGKESKGSIEAVNLEQATALLKADGKIPVKVKEAGAMDKDIKILQKKPTPRDMAVYCRQFVSIVEAGVPVTSALEMLAEQTENPLLADAIDKCRAGIQAGTSLSEAMQEHPNVFPPLFVTMVAAGEASGTLEVAFDRMGTQFEKDAKIQGMVKKASVYPITIMIVAVVVVAVLLVMVIPTFEEMLADMGQELPWITKMVVGASQFMQEYWYIIAAVAVGAILFFRSYAKTDSGQRIFGSIQRKLPLFGNLAMKTASSRMCRTMSTLLAAGVPLIDALEIVANTMPNIHYKEAILDARDDVAMGTPLSEPLRRCGMFPPLVYHMTKIGEEVGDLEGMQNKLADYYDEEVEAAVAALMAAMEPAIIILLAGVIGTIVMSVMIPMGQMTTALGDL